MSIKIIGLIILLVFLVFFAAQNAQPVAVKLLFWQIPTSAAVSIMISFIVGFLVGWLVCIVGRKEKVG
ncbi:MAG: LapA family protein [Thermodesulfobacteriota bacterium]|nr:LapA family protein [Thermodesulfobacteriota bacterium]